MSEMQDNPYSAMLGMFRGDVERRAVPSWTFGILRGISPLEVEIGSQKVTTGLYINPLLLERNCSARLFGLSGELNGSSAGIEVANGNLSGKAELDKVVEIGDRVVLLQSADGQNYIILCKAVST